MRFFSCLLVALFLSVSFTAKAIAFLPEPQQSLFINEGQGLTAEDAAPAEKLYAKGIEALAKNKLGVAQKAFEDSIYNEPRSIKSILGLAEVFFKQGNIAQAGKVLGDAAKNFESNAAIQKALGRYLYLEKRFDEAEVAFKKAIAITPNYIDPRVDLGDMYLNALNRPEEAAQVYRDTLAINPNIAGVHYALGMALLSVKSDDEALAEFEKAAVLETENPLPIYALAREYTKRKDFENSLKMFDKIIEINPKFSRAYVEKGDVFLIKGDADKAINEFKNAQKVDQKSAAIFTKLGMAYQMKKDWRNAESAYKAAIKLDPKQAFAYNDLAWVIMENKGNPTEAVAAAKSAVQLAPRAIEFQDTLQKAISFQK